MKPPDANAAAALAAELPRLLLAAERLAYAAAPGTHGRRRTGPGDDFLQFRDFRPDDDARGIDWRRSAGAGRYFVREREWQAQASVALRLEDHPGMQFRSAGDLPSKSERATLLLLALAALLLKAGEKVALAGITPPLSGGAALEKLALGLAKGGSAPPDRRARVIAFGDFLAPEPAFRTRPGGAVLHILDPAECDFPYTGRVIFAGFEAEREIEAQSAQAWAGAYRARIAAQREAVRQAAQRSGQTPLFHRTDAPPASALAALFQALARS